MPGEPKLVLEPATLALLTAILRQESPVGINLLLVVAWNLQRDCFIELELRTTIESNERSTEHLKFDHDLLAQAISWSIGGCNPVIFEATIRKDAGVEGGSFSSLPIKPEASR